MPPALDRLLQQCLAKNPAHRPQSALELARSLQQIESAAGWSRTAVAVEGDRPDSSVRAVAPEPEEDRTVMKAVTVISASGPRRIATAQEEQEAEEQEQSRGVSGVVWAAAGVVAVAAAVVALVLGGGDRPDDREADGPLTPTETTPSDLVPARTSAPPPR